MHVPKEISDSYFFSQGFVQWKKEDDRYLNLKQPLIYEVAHFSGYQSLKPWEIESESIPLLLKEWEVVKEQLTAVFKKRDGKASSLLMKNGIGLFLEFLHWANAKPVKLIPAIQYDQLKVKPVNIHERLDFILSRPNSYHSYMQIVELMTELEKMYRKNIAIKNVK